MDTEARLGLAGDSPHPVANSQHLSGFFIGAFMEIPGALWRNMIFRHSELESNAKLVGAYLSTWMDEHGNNCYPSVKRIAHETGLSEKTVCKYIAVLRDTGWLAAEKHGYDGQAWARNHYYPLIPHEHAEEFARHLTRFSASQKGTVAASERHLPGGRKALKELQSSNIVSKTISNTVENNNFLSPKPSTGSWDEWEKWGQENGFPAKRGESYSAYIVRLKAI